MTHRSTVPLLDSYDLLIWIIIIDSLSGRCIYIESNFCGHKFALLLLDRLKVQFDCSGHFLIAELAT